MLYKRIVALATVWIIILAFATVVIAQYTGTIRVGNGFFGTFQVVPEGVTPEVMMAGLTYPALDMYSLAVDGTGQILGIMNFGANANTGEKRVVRIFGYTQGTTVNNRGGRLVFTTKADGGVLSDRWSIENNGTLQAISTTGAVTHSFINPVAAVDGVSCTGATTANPATVSCSASGTDANININFVSKGAGTVQSNGVAITAAPTITFKKGTGLGNYTTTSGTYVRVDTTNLVLTVTVPVGQKIVIDAICYVVTAGTNVVFTRCALADGTADNTGILIEGEAVTYNSSSWNSIPLKYVFVGDGASHTFNLQFKATTAASTATIANLSSTFTPVMSFWMGVAN
jgi:hypothetical protein